MAREQATDESVRIRTLPTQVAARLTRQIVNGKLAEGRCPSESDICREFGVSRVVARETLKVLASLDVVEIAQGRRVTLRPRAEWNYLSPVLIEWLPAEQVDALLEELHEARLLLEPELATKAAQGMDEETLAELRADLDRMASLEDDPERYLEADHEFHMRICRAADNRILDRIMYSARWLLAASRRVTNEVPGGLRRATRAHQQVFSALEARNPQAAHKAMRSHLERNYFVLHHDR